MSQNGGIGATLTQVSCLQDSTIVWSLVIIAVVWCALVFFLMPKLFPSKGQRDICARGSGYYGDDCKTCMTTPHYDICDDGPRVCGSEDGSTKLVNSHGDDYSCDNDEFCKSAGGSDNWKCWGSGNVSSSGKVPEARKCSECTGRPGMVWCANAKFCDSSEECKKLQEEGKECKGCCLLAGSEAAQQCKNEDGTCGIASCPDASGCCDSVSGQVCGCDETAPARARANCGPCVDGPDDTSCFCEKNAGGDDCTHKTTLENPKNYCCTMHLDKSKGGKFCQENGAATTQELLDLGYPKEEVLALKLEEQENSNPRKVCPADPYGEFAGTVSNYNLARSAKVEDTPPGACSHNTQCLPSTDNEYWCEGYTNNNAHGMDPPSGYRCCPYGTEHDPFLKNRCGQQPIGAYCYSDSMCISGSKCQCTTDIGEPDKQCIGTLNGHWGYTGKCVSEEE